MGGVGGFPPTQAGFRVSNGLTGWVIQVIKASGFYGKSWHGGRATQGIQGSGYPRPQWIVKVDGLI